LSGSMGDYLFIVRMMIGQLRVKLRDEDQGWAATIAIKDY